MPGNAFFRKLFEPGRIGGMTVRNRTVMAPMGTNLCSQRGYITRRQVDYYEARAAGGVGLLLIEAMAVDPGGRRRFRELSLYNDTFIPGLRRLAEAVHRHGARLAPQLNHRGQQARRLVTGRQPVSPSALATLPGETPRELTVPETKDIIRRFGAAAVRAQKAGCDGVELHAAHAYLISQFLSPASNARVDEYGGSLENRARFLLEIIREVRSRVGQEFPVWLRITAQEYGIENGITLEETTKVLRWAEATGADAVNVSVFGYGDSDPVSLPDVPGAELPLAAQLKSALKIPVIAVGWLTAETGERALEDGAADFICFGRRLLADPDYVAKTATGQTGLVRPCIGCRMCMQTAAFYHEPVQCVVNAALGREREWNVSPAARKKKIVVVGGGPAGMETARVAAARGHEVVLLEKDRRLGGLLNQAAVPPRKGPLADLVRYYEHSLGRDGVDVRLGTEVTAPVVTALRPDAVVVADGAAHLVPRVTGVDRPDVVTASDVLAGTVLPGKKAVVIGGGMVGCETAEYLAARGHDVTVLELLDSLAVDMEVGAVRQRLLKALADRGVRWHTGITCEEINDRGVSISRRDGVGGTVPAETVILAAGFGARPGLFRSLRGMAPDVHHIGDSARPAGIREAIREGFRTARSL